MESAKIIADLMVFFAQMIKRIVEAVEGLGKRYDARSLEAYVEEQCKALGAVTLETCLRLRMKGQTPSSSLSCVCGRRKHYLGPRPREVQAVLGKIQLEERYYYRCDQCGAVEYLGDELRGASHFSPLAEERIAIAGKEGAFAKAAEQLQRLGVLCVAASTVRQVCARLGQRVRKQMDADAAGQYGAQAPQPEEHNERLAIGVDGTMLGRIDTQHRRRKSAKKGKVRGKTKLQHFFHEVKTLVIFNFDQTGQTLRKTFQATQERVEQFREKVSLEALRRGAQTAKLLVFLGDGAPWVWKTAQELFPKAIQILDWYHAMEHLWAVGRARFGAREKELWAWVKTQEKELWEGRVTEVLEALRAVSQQMGAPDPALSETARATDARWIAHRNVGYFEENSRRMNYPMYRAQGLPIGSGVVESGCKHVVGDRLKRTGMRWDEPGAEDILALRCHDLNGRWDTIWASQTA
jgi:hypothetical protein